MKSLMKLGMLGVVVAFMALVAGATVPTSAAPVSFTVNGLTTAQSPAVPSTNVVNGTYNDEGVGDFTLTSSAASTIGYFLPGTFALGTNNDAQVITPNSATVPTQIIVSEDVDVVAEATSFQVFFQCVSAGATTLSYTQGGGASTSIVLTCTAAAGTNTITFNPTSTTVNGVVTVSAVCTAAGQILTVTAGVGSLGVPTQNGTFVSATQANCIAAGTMLVNYTCTVAGTITFTLNGVNASLVCGATTTSTLVLSSTTGMSGTVTGTCTVGAPLTQTGPAQFTNATINGVQVAVTAGSVACTVAGTMVASFTCNSTGAVYLSLGAQSGTFTCSGTGGYYGGYPYNNYPYNNINCGTGAYTPYATGAYNPYATGVYNPYTQYNTNTNCYNQQQYTSVPTSLTITSASPSVACGSNAAITVRVVGTNGGTVTDGTMVSLSSSVGTFSPAQATTAAGVVQATWTAPSSIPATTAQLKAIAGTATNTASVSVTCASTTAPSAPSTTAPVYTSPPPPPSTFPVITPPSTGDAGLLAAIRDEECN